MGDPSPAGSHGRILSTDQLCFCPDVSESPWRGRFTPKSGGPLDLPALEQPPEDLPQTCPSPGHAGTLPPKPLLPAPVRNGESLSLEGLANLFLDTQGDLHPNFLERSRLRKVRTFPRLLPEGPEAGGPCPSLTNSQKPPVSPQGASVQGAGSLSGSRAPSSRWPEVQQGGAEGPDQHPPEGSPPPCPQNPPDAGPTAGPLRAAGAPDRGEPGSAAHKQVRECP